MPIGQLPGSTSIDALTAGRQLLLCGRKGAGREPGRKGERDERECCES